MEEQREGTELVGDDRAPMEEAGKGLGSSSKTETLGCEVDANTVEALDSGVCDVSGIDETLNDEKTDVLTEPEAEIKRSKEITLMEEQREGTELVGDARVPMEEAGKGSSKTETLACEDDKAVEALESGVCDVSGTDETPNDGGSGNIVRSDDVEKTALAERNQEECEGGAEVKLVNGESGEETVISAGNKVSDEKGTCEVGDDNPNDATTEKSQKSSAGGETLSAAEDKADQEKESANESDEGNNKMDVDSKHANGENVESESKDGKHSESVAEENLTNVNQKEENGEAMEIDSTAEEPVEKDVLDDAGNESAAVNMIQTQDAPIAEAERNESNLVKEMEVDEGKDNADMASDLTGKNQSGDSANPNSSTEDAAPREAEPLDDNALFDPRSDITSFIDFSGVSSWTGNIQDHKTETGNVSLKEDKKATDMADEVATEECNETPESVGATEGQKEAPDAIKVSEEIQKDKDHQSSEEKALDQQDTRMYEDDTTHEVPSNDPNQKEDTVMEENPNNFEYAEVGTDSDTKTNGVKRKADVLSEDLLGEGRKTVSLAKVSSFKIGACIARAASQMAGTPTVLKDSNVGDETLSVESFVSQLHCAATDTAKENVISETASGFFLNFRNSTASQQFTPEKASSKRARPSSNSNAGGTEAFEFEEMGDTYWTDRVIHNGGEEQTPHAEKEHYQVVPVELKPAQVKRTRRPYRRRQSQIISPLPPASDKPLDFDENAPAELIMNFSETDTIPPEKSLSKMFRHFGPIKDSQTEVDTEKNRARVVFRKGADAEVAYKSARKFNIFGTKAVNYELSFTVTETFKVQPYVVSLGEEEAVLPVEEAVVHDEEAVLPVEEAVLHEEEAVLPVEEAKLPVEEAVLPVEEAVLHEEEAVLAVEEAVLPVEEAKLPVEEAVLPLEEAVLPEEEAVQPVPSS